MTDQSVTKSEHVTQVAGNVQVVHNHGISLNDLKDIVTILMREHMPALKAEAAATARENAEEFCKTFEEKLAPQIPHINPKNFADPDIQSSIHDAVLNSAKKGKNAHAELLASTLILRLKEAPESYPSLVCSEAIKIIPSLTANQISFLTLAVFLLSTKINSANSLSDLLPLATAVYEMCVDSYPVLESEKGYLQFKGCVSINRFSGGSYLDVMKSNYGFLSQIPDPKEAEKQFIEFAVLKRFSEIYNDTNMSQITLTPVGMVIGVTNMARHVPNIDYKNWLNQ